MGMFQPGRTRESLVIPYFLNSMRILRSKGSETSWIRGARSRTGGGEEVTRGEGRGEVFQTFCVRAIYRQSTQSRLTRLFSVFWAPPIKCPHVSKNVDFWGF